MIRRCTGVFAIMFAVTLIFAPAMANAQDEDTRLEYAGPFGEDTADTTTETTADEVLGQTLEAGDSMDATDDASADDYLPSIDNIGDDKASHFVAPDLSLSAADAATIGGTGGGLAATGSDVEPILAISVGLLAVGGSALVSSRRRVRDFFL